MKFYFHAISYSELNIGQFNFVVFLEPLFMLCRLLTEKADSLIVEVDRLLEDLRPMEDNAAFNFVNAVEDLLWAFERRASASWVLQLAIKKSIYRHNLFR